MSRRVISDPAALGWAYEADIDRWGWAKSGSGGGDGGDGGGDGGGGNGTLPPFTDISEVASTFLYSGNGTSQTIKNNVDLAGKGGLVWIKDRTRNGQYHSHFNTETGLGTFLYGDQNWVADTTGRGITAYNADGFDVDDYDDVNASGSNYVAWTFRKANKFFDVATYSGNGVVAQIPHGLGVKPGLVIVKCTSHSGDWAVYHEAVGADKRLELNSNANAVTDMTVWGGVEPTDSLFTVASSGLTNEAGKEYVAYFFANDDSASSIIKCGSYTAIAGKNDIDLGWEPQFIFIKRFTSTGASNWSMMDTARGIPSGLSADDNPILFANYPNSEFYQDGIETTATGFSVQSNTNFAELGVGYIYMAIRKDSNALRNPDFDAQNAEVQAIIAAKKAAKEAVKEKVKDKASERKKR